MSVCMYVSMYAYVYICVHYYSRVMKYHQLIFQANNYIKFSLHSNQQNKQTNK